MIKKIKLKIRIYGLVAFLLIVQSIVCITSLKIIYNMDDTVDEIGENLIPLIRVMAKATEQLLNQSLHFNMLLQYSKIYKKEEFKHEDSGFTESGKRFIDMLKEGKNIAQSCIKVSVTKKNKTDFEKIRDVLEILEKEHNEYEHKSEELISILYIKSFENEHRAETVIMNDMMKPIERMKKETTTMKQELNKGLELIDELTRIMLDNAHKKKAVAIEILIPMMFISIAGGFFLSISIARITVNQIQDSIHKMKEIAESASVGVDQIATTANDLAQSSVSQASSLEQISSSTSHINTLIQQNCQTSSETQQLIRNIDKNMTKAEISMQKLNLTIMESLESEKKAETLFNQLSDYNLQINLLATNASAEASRNESTQSFGIFTQKIDQASQNAHTINTNISDVLRNSLETIKKNFASARILRNVLHKISNMTETADNKISQITENIQKDSKKFVEIDKAIKVLNNVIHSNAANSEEFSAASSNMADQVRNLLLVSRDMELMIEGRKA
ncbi:conserved hypothetical protein, membrane [Candidatus Magnetomorum sp. HK-1]|nr:conserved hypothetical protein, membrane [Candidatus Magnetomorum sp. HK-1]